MAQNDFDDIQFDVFLGRRQRVGGDQVPRVTIYKNLGEIAFNLAAIELLGLSKPPEGERIAGHVWLGYNDQRGVLGIKCVQDGDELPPSKAFPVRRQSSSDAIYQTSAKSFLVAHGVLPEETVVFEDVQRNAQGWLVVPLGEKVGDRQLVLA